MGVRRLSTPGRHGSGPLGELDLITAIGRRARGLRAASGRELRLGIGDDCAILRPRRGEELVLTTDLSLEGRHFRREWHSPQSIGHRALARSLSDLAAMGARPVAAFLSLALPKSLAQDASWLQGLLDGFFSLAKSTQTPLAGGDTSESPGEFALLDVVLTGAVPAGKALLRSGARPCDGLYVTGALGGAAAELAAISQGPGARHRTAASSAGADPHLFPEPRLLAGRALLRRGLAAAAIDLSDGLSTDLWHLCEASGVQAEVEASRLPLHSLTSGGDPQEALRLALHGGEDYELLFTARAGTRVPRRLGGVPITRVGQILPPSTRRPRVMLRGSDGQSQPLERGGWEHLR